MRIPDDYRGFRLSSADAVQIGHKTEGGGLRKQLGIGTSRKVRGVWSVAPDGCERFHDTLRAAKQFIDGYLS